MAFLGHKSPGTRATRIGHPTLFARPEGESRGLSWFVRFPFPLIAALLLGTVSARAATPEELALQPYTAPPSPDSKAWPRARLLGFMHELADFVEKNHVVTD